MKKINILLAICISAFILCSCEDLLNPTNSKGIAAELEGHWKCDETLKSPNDIHYPYISLDGYDSTKVIISNFNGLGDSYEVTANVNGYTITIPDQSMIDGYSAHGTGTISTNLKQINWEYYVDDGSGQYVGYDGIYTFQY